MTNAEHIERPALNEDCRLGTCAFYLLYKDGHFVDSNSRLEAEEVARAYSRAKYGEPEAIQFFGAAMEEAALGDNGFLDFLESTRSTHPDIIITSPGIRNVPKASKLLAEYLANRLTIYTSHKDLQPVTLDTPVPVDMEVVKRIVSGRDPWLASLTPGKYAGHPVIYVSDLKTSAEGAEKAVRQIMEVGQATAAYPLFAVNLNIAESDHGDGDVRELMASRTIDGSLASIKSVIVKADNPIVQRTLRNLFAPEHAPYLRGYLEGMSDQALIRLYISVSNSDFRWIFNGDYAGQIRVLEKVLHEKGWVDASGRLFNRQKFVKSAEVVTTEPYRIVNYWLNSKRDIPFEKAREYSLMKYSDPNASEAIAQAIAENILASSKIQEVVAKGEPIVLTSSAYGSVPTAAAIISWKIEDIFKSQGIKVDKVKINRSGQFAVMNFGALSQAEREIQMKARKIGLSPADTEKLKGATVLAIDDLCATGSHERAIRELMATTEARETIFAYYIKFGERLMVNEPDTEEWLNKAGIQTLTDMIPMIRKLGLAKEETNE